jgi:outer membrane translocation and assembly module TamA
MRSFYLHIIAVIASVMIIYGCSTTSSLEDGDVLYTGLKATDYNNYEKNDHQSNVEEEVEAALATAPNGALFGSSYYRTPFPYGLWIWNAFSKKEGVVSKWLVNSFGKAPVLMSNVNPVLRAQVAKNVLQNNGYFNGDVTFDTFMGKPETTNNDTVKRPRTAKIQYHVNFGDLYMLDSIDYINFSPDVYNKITSSDMLIKRGNPFSIATLDNERTRISNLLKNKGYYYYQPSYITFFADTFMVPKKVQLRVMQLDSLPENVTRKWIIGKTDVMIKKEFREQLTDSLQRRFLTIHFNGKRPPIRPRIILADTKLRPGMLYSQDSCQESLNNLTSKGVFSSVDISFKPRVNPDGTYVSVPDTVSMRDGEVRAGAGILDMTVNATLDKPYDFVFEADAMGKTSGRIGPGVSIGLTKRNAFHGGEILNINAGANYEFQVGGEQDMGNSYDFSLGASLALPRLLLPKLWKKRKRWYTTPSTLINVSGEMIRRASFFNREILSSEFTYIFQPSERSVHKLSPLIVTYGRTSNISDTYIEKIRNSATSIVALNDELTPKIRYTYTYSSAKDVKSPIYWQFTVSEAGNITDLLHSTFSGKRLNEKGKKILSTPFSQFLKFETEFRKTWFVGEKSSFVFHFYGGIMSAYGNNTEAPFAEQFYIGGANDLRGFSMRSIGPGEVHFTETNMAYLFHTGDTKVVLNAEYRPHLFGSLYAALFVDIGNVWSLRHSVREESKEAGLGDPAKKDVGVDVGLGIRYDLDFFVLRLDWGFAIHNPYTSGFVNCGSFRKAQVLNFAIGYPF